LGSRHGPAAAPTDPAESQSERSPLYPSCKCLRSDGATQAPVPSTEPRLPCREPLPGAWSSLPSARSSRFIRDQGDIRPLTGTDRKVNEGPAAEIKGRYRRPQRMKLPIRASAMRARPQPPGVEVPHADSIGVIVHGSEAELSAVVDGGDAEGPAAVRSRVTKPIVGCRCVWLAEPPGSIAGPHRPRAGNAARASRRSTPRISLAACRWVLPQTPTFRAMSYFSPEPEPLGGMGAGADVFNWVMPLSYACSAR
jgi:hypothetical protein